MLAVLVLALTTLIAAIDTNIVNIGLPTISAVLHTGFSDVQWVMLSYLLAVTALIVGAGRIGDLFGKKWIFLGGILLFTLASLLCGFSTSIWMLVALRALQGIGGAVLMALSFALAGDLMPQERILSCMSVLTAMLPIGFALGPTVGGILLRFFSWRALFFFNVPLGILAFLFALTFPALPPQERHRRFDFTGMLLLTAALVCYVLGVTTTEDVGFAMPVLALFGAFVLLLAVFLLWEKRTVVPLLDLSLFKSPTFAASLAVSVLVYTVITGNWLILPFYLQQGKMYSTFVCGLMMTVGPVGCAIFTPVSSALAERFGSYRVMKLGVLAFAAGTFLMATLGQNTTPLRFMATLFFFNGSLAFFQTPNNAQVISDARPERRGVASSLLNLSRTVGQTTGASVMGAIFYCFTGTKTVANAAPAAIVTGIRTAYFSAGFISVAALLVAFFFLRKR